MNTNKPKILVTGGMGYIGSHTVVKLAENDFYPIIIDNLSNSSEKVLGNIAKILGYMPPFVKLDLRDQNKVADFFDNNKDIKGVIHFAALKAVGESMQMPIEYYRNNIASLLNVLENMKIHNIENIVFSSSCTVYGQPDKLPVTENSPIKEAVSAYGNTKQMSEDILKFTCNAHDIKCISLRYFNPIGAHQSALIGELPIGVPNNLMPFITQTAAGIREQLKVFGGDYNTPDGTAIRDYIHVVDLAQAHVSAVNRMLNNQTKSNLEFFNVGTGNGYSVLEVINSFERVSNQKLNYVITERRSGDIEKVWADTNKANKELGWKAELSLDEMTLSAWNWQLALEKSK
ncbi:MAG: UDP-glucose 4-epimerase GalE [Bacteroidales bacterium]|jgi:UDP-glucose 4-epimerase